MFGLYKNIISGNFRMLDGWDDLKRYEDEVTARVRNIMQKSRETVEWAKSGRQIYVTTDHPPLDNTNLYRYKLFELPILPHIPAPSDITEDIVLPPYLNIYVEGLNSIYNPLSSNSPNDLRSTVCGVFINYYPNNEIKTGGCFISCFHPTKKGTHILHMPMDICFNLNERGTFIDEVIIGLDWVQPIYRKMLIGPWKNWILSFLRFINLSNIEIEKAIHTSADRKYYQKQKSNQIHYHILTVKKPTYTKNKLQKEDSETISLPLHQVRGHLADYTKGKGLFGKYKIRVWIPDHWRGSLQYGKINKDYKLSEYSKNEKTIIN